MAADVALQLSPPLQSFLLKGSNFGNSQILTFIIWNWQYYCQLNVQGAKKLRTSQQPRFQIQLEVSKVWKEIYTCTHQILNYKNTN